MTLKWNIDPRLDTENNMENLILNYSWQEEELMPFHKYPQLIEQNSTR